MYNSYVPMDCSPPNSSVHGISQARILEWVAISSSRGSSHPGIKPESLALTLLDLELQLQPRTSSAFTWPLAGKHQSYANESESESHSVVSDFLRLYSPWNSLGQNTGVGSLSLLHGIFSTQGLNAFHIAGRFFTN